MSIPQALFIHVPRTGGNTIEHCLGPSLYHFDHQSLAQAAERLSAYEFGRVFKFTVLRDPWRRAYSAFTLHHQSRHELRNRWIEDDAKQQRKLFKRWWRSDEKAGNWYRRYTPDVLIGEDIDLLDHVYKFEDGVASIVHRVARKCKVRVRGSATTKHKRSTLDSFPLGQVMTNSIVDEIGELCRLEIERFKYSAPIVT